MEDGESSGSRGVIGGVGHVRGEWFGHERGVSSPATEPAAEPASELEGDERRERWRERDAALRCCA